MALTELFVDKYRPQLLKDYVFRDEQFKRQMEEIVKNQTLPNCGFYGPAGTGKSCIAKILINELGIDELDVLELNASRNNSIDDVRNTITNFVQMMPYGDYRVVLLQEFDHFSVPGQAGLRDLIESYSSTARFVLTGNYQNRIIPAIHSRCHAYIIDKMDKVEFEARVATILVEEKIEFDIDTLDLFVKVSYPDLRKCIGMVQMNSIGGKLISPDSSESGSTDYQLEMVSLFKQGKILEARKLLCSKARPEEIVDIYKWCYQNFELFGNTPKKQDDAILIIKQALVDHTVLADPEIGLSACMIRLMRNMEKIT